MSAQSSLYENKIHFTISFQASPSWHQLKDLVFINRKKHFQKGMVFTISYKALIILLCPPLLHAFGHFCSFLRQCTSLAKVIIFCFLTVVHEGTKIQNSSLRLTDLYLNQFNHYFFFLFSFRYNSKRRHWRRTKLKL